MKFIFCPVVSLYKAFLIQVIIHFCCRKRNRDSCLGQIQVQFFRKINGLLHGFFGVSWKAEHKIAHHFKAGLFSPGNRVFKMLQRGPFFDRVQYVLVAGLDTEIDPVTACLLHLYQQFQVNTVSADATAIRDSAAIRRSTLLRGIPYCTTVAGARASVGAILAMQAGSIGVRALQEIHPSE